MEVTQENFEAAVPRLRDALARCEFVAVDTELTGVQSEGSGPLRSWEPPHARYASVRKAGEEFLLIQLGVCTFEWSAQRDRLLARPFSFFAFPRSSERRWQKHFTAQAASLDFLSKHKFDFNKLIYKGVSYLSRRDEALWREDVQQKAERRAANSDRPAAAPSRPADVQFLATVREQMSAFVAKEADAALASLRLDPASSFQRMLVYQVAESEFPQLMVEKEANPGAEHRPFLRLRFAPAAMQKEEAEKREQAARDEVERQIASAVGLRAVVDAISDAGKPIVGHNCFMDMVQIFSTFFGPCSPSYAHFKRDLRAIFPAVFDSKFLCHHPLVAFPDASSALGDVYQSIAKSGEVAGPPVELAEGFGGGVDSAHDAGFDAFMTGSIFIKLLHPRHAQVEADGADASAMPPSLATMVTSLALSPRGRLIAAQTVNRLYLMGSEYHVNLGGSDDFFERMSSAFYIAAPEAARLTFPLIRDAFARASPLPIAVQWLSAPGSRESRAIVRLLEAPAAPAAAAAAAAALSSAFTPRCESERPPVAQSPAPAAQDPAPPVPATPPAQISPAEARRIVQEVVSGAAPFVVCTFAEFVADQRTLEADPPDWSVTAGLMRKRFAAAAAPAAAAAASGPQRPQPSAGARRPLESEAAPSDESTPKRIKL